MILVLFHVICLLGKFVYQKYQCIKRKPASDVMQESQEKQGNARDIFRMVDVTNNDDDRDLETSSTLRFYPPAYVQRYTAVTDVLTDPRFQRKLRKVVDFGCSELGFLNYMKNIEGVKEILCVDVDSLVLELHKSKADPLILEYVACRPCPLVIELCKGSVADSDKKLEGTDAVVCIELIEHLYPETLTDLPYNIFGYIRPQVAIITTPNADFNVLFPNFTGFRHYDHKFEWTRQQFQDWAENVVLRFPNYEVTFHGICYGPKGTEHLGACSQMAVFTRICDFPASEAGVEGLYKTVALVEYPYKEDNRSDECKIRDEALYHITKLSYQDGERQEQVPLSNLVNILEPFSVTLETLRTILVDSGRVVEDTENGPVVLIPELTESELSDNYDIDNTSMHSDIDNEWDMGIGPMRGNSAEVMQRDVSIEDWDNECWDEPSIIIPQQNYEMQNSTNLMDDLNTSVTLERGSEFIEEYESDLGTAEMPYYPSDNIRDISTNPALPNILNPRNDDDPDRSLDHNFSVSSNAENLEGGGEASFMNVQSASQRRDNMQDFHAWHSDSRMLRGDSGMSNESTLNSTFHNLDISSEEDVQADNTTSKEEEPVNEQLEKEQNVQYPNTSNYVRLNDPQFTSSPKLDAKVASKGGKRRSLVYPTQFNSRRQEQLEEIDVAVCEMNAITLQNEEAGVDSSNTTTDNDTSASRVTVDNFNSDMQESWTGNCSSLDKKRKLNSSIEIVPDVPLTCSSFDCALKKVASQSGDKQIGTLACDIEARTDDSYTSTKETILGNAVEQTSSTKSSTVLTHDKRGRSNSCIRKRKSLSPLPIVENQSPEDNSSEGITDSGYPNSASTQGTPTDCDFSDIAEDCKSSVATETHCSDGI